MPRASSLIRRLVHAGLNGFYMRDGHVRQHDLRQITTGTSAVGREKRRDDRDDDGTEATNDDPHDNVLSLAIFETRPFNASRE